MKVDQKNILILIVNGSLW